MTTASDRSVLWAAVRKIRNMEGFPESALCDEQMQLGNVLLNAMAAKLGSVSVFCTARHSFACTFQKTILPSHLRTEGRPNRGARMSEHQKHVPRLCKPETTQCPSSSPWICSLSFAVNYAFPLRPAFDCRSQNCPLLFCCTVIHSVGERMVSSFTGSSDFFWDEAMLCAGYTS